MSFANTIISWYAVNKRDLPWRRTTNPYFIWLSEIILQQTRVEQGRPYYERYVEAYPTIFDLAAAPEDEVMKLWQGLGYYSRARNMHATAKQIVNEYGGKFPPDHDKILKLKGIGEYTAAAIASLSFNLPHAVVDGNVYRVLSRYYGIKTPINKSAAKKEFYELANQLLDTAHPDLFNQAIMEIGAIQCKPQSPNCKVCPLTLDCYARKNNIVAELPVKEKKQKARDRYFHYLFVNSKDSFSIRKRPAGDIWQDLYDFPIIETGKLLDESELIKIAGFKELMPGKGFKIINTSAVFKHQLTHQTIYAKFFHIEIDNSIEKSLLSKDYIFINDTELEKYSVPRLIDKYLQSIFSDIA